MHRMPVLAIFALTILVSCSTASQPEKRVEPAIPSTAFGGRPEAPVWTASVLASLGKHGAPLVETVPADIRTYCPGYAAAAPEDRKAFWVTFLSALAKHESTWRPEAAGGGGAWLGLLQISPATARGYGCRATDSAALRDGAANLSCAIRIMAVTVPRDGVISAGNGGVAADWAPFRDPAKMADIQTTTRRAQVCRG